jgi:amidophosphoribosyltransferase
MGRVLAREHPVEADVVIAIPDSGVPMALGYSQEAHIPLELGLVRNHYVGRTFIEPSQSIRDFGVKLKLNAISSVLDGKRVVVIDDSIVRGTTSTKIVRMLRGAGASEIHFRIGSPPITHSCHYGVATPDRRKLLAAQKDVREICRFLGADSLAYLSIGGLREALKAEGYCTACFTGDYPEEIFEPVEPQPTDEVGPGLYAQVTGPRWRHR